MFFIFLYFYRRFMFFIFLFLFLVNSFNNNISYRKYIKCYLLDEINLATKRDVTACNAIGYLLRDLISELKDNGCIRWDNIKDEIEGCKPHMLRHNFYERVVEDGIRVATEHKDWDGARLLQQVHEYVKPWLEKKRTENNTWKMQELLNAASSKGSGTFEKRVGDMDDAEMIDSNFLKYLNNLVKQAYEMNPEAKDDENLVMEIPLLRILLPIRDRIMAQIHLKRSGTLTDVKIFSFARLISDRNERKMFIKKSIKSIEELNNLHQFLTEALDHCREEKIKFAKGDILKRYFGEYEDILIQEMIDDVTVLNPILKPPDIQNEDSLRAADFDLMDLLEKLPPEGSS
eukprot:GHVL01033615.1.p1 GENE.GHVL01033615.1~~GHVL01033615.1.p1  ORF type:complete len:345 (+),score=79.69 GHVL01033615.1:2-1036(+)